MNKSRKILTLVALAAFGAIVSLHYIPKYERSHWDYVHTTHCDFTDEYIAKVEKFNSNPEPTEADYREAKYLFEHMQEYQTCTPRILEFRVPGDWRRYYSNPAGPCNRLE
jgi:hypothetical protein